MCGGEALVKALERAGVEVMFGLPGGAILPVYDPIIDSSIRHILVRHEQGAGHMAEGYAHATGRPGVVMVTSGPAATNVVTPLCDAFLDSVPMVCITGQVPYAAIGTDAFQECDTTGITMAVTKHNFLVTEAQDIPRTIRAAFHIATTGRPGPVLVDIPKDIVDPVNPRSAMTWYEATDADMDLPGYHPITQGDPELIRAAAEMIRTAERPVLYVGGGILKSRAAEALLQLAEMVQIPVVTTLMARGAFPDSHDLCLGMPGMHGNFTAVTAMQKSDLLISLGARFDDRVTGKLDGFAPDAKIIHVDIDPAELGKVRRVDIGIQGDCRLVIEDLTTAMREIGGTDAQVDRGAWRSTISGWQEKFPLVYEQSELGERLKPQYVLEELRDNNPADTIVTSGVGQHQMYASQYWKFDYPYTWINSGGLGTMGFSIPAAIGAKVGKPDRRVWAVDGDGCFQMTAQELVTASVEDIPIKVALLNNSYLGMVRQWQEMFYDERFSEVYLSEQTPDYVKWSEAMGCVGIRVESPEEVAPAITKANEINDRPVVVEFRTDPRENVFPMVPAGKSNSELVVDPSQQGLEP
ncbi:MAG: biosynthetic-type acetolactate synthase large subunit [Acidimicrobiaceae bacterium]|nr:biosynthetic-type acetolactate synthase large subunit [Acidimicrobiaceae bacterium]MYA73573.1 biosynthetic-type acetolactate synthase large subunit [Acidimicrobiaceae bacterium]MYC41508.1 biosynthetic-type acetolactate synthase large subunit [Acidimicrobiaceae bacterium]MYG56218.1 biosynthetic-type acetolactate synthase large subunit [Acidimicrobiaceae bacterium]MYJ98424.1 biosynthetic-type acetolactate synthase large subunit [Acidimicrobiaceae bacterium]